jgi:ABC-2 type transport system permease protein
MNLAIWKKAIWEAWRSLLVCSVLLALFAWLFVWLMCQFQLGTFGLMLRMVPKFMQTAMGVPVADLATRTGQFSILFVHVVTLLVCVGWALARGSAPVAGEIGRGTMDLILSLPIWRPTLVVVAAVVAAVGSAILVGSVCAGLGLGLLTVDVGEKVALATFLPGAVNLFFMTFAFTGITMLVSALSRDRWHVMAVAGGVFIASFIIKMVARLWSAGAWLGYFSFLSAFEPQSLILVGDENGPPALAYNATLLGLGLACYLAAAAVLWYRDIPAAK